MRLSKLFSNWTKVASLFLMGGALAWTIKLCIIISTNGRIINTGVAALLMTAGIIMLGIGSTGVGYRLSLKWPLVLRIIATVISPVLVFALLFSLGMLLNPLFKNTGVWYAEQEAPIALGVIFYMAIGYALYKNYRPASIQVRS